MTLTVALPSPPNGQVAVRRPLIPRLGNLLRQAFALEPVDDAAYLAAGSVLFTWAVHAATTLFALSPLSTFAWLTNIQRFPVWTVVTVAQLLGFASRSRTARAIAVFTAATLALGLSQLWLPVLSTGLMEGLYWTLRAGTTAATVLWSLRTLRRWLGRDNE